MLKRASKVSCRNWTHKHTQITRQNWPSQCGVCVCVFTGTVKTDMLSASWTHAVHFNVCCHSVDAQWQSTKDITAAHIQLCSSEPETTCSFTLFAYISLRNIDITSQSQSIQKMPCSHNYNSYNKSRFQDSHGSFYKHNVNTFAKTLQ